MFVYALFFTDRFPFSRKEQRNRLYPFQEKSKEKIIPFYVSKRAQKKISNPSLNKSKRNVSDPARPIYIHPFFVKGEDLDEKRW